MVHRSPYPDVEIPDCTLTEFVFETAARRSEHAAFIDGLTGRTTSFGEWAALVRRTAAGLAARGLRPGEVVAMFSPNLPEYGVVLHGTALAGGIVTTANPLHRSTELRRQLEDCRARYVVTIPPFLATVREAIQGLDVREVFVVEFPAGGSSAQTSDATPFGELSGSKAPPPDVAVRPDDVFVLPYSSGTTGLPKGVMLTHRNLVANVLQLLAVMDQTENDRVMALLPYFHIYGMVVVMHGALRIGATQVTLPRFELDQFLDTLERHRITAASLVPPIILLLGQSAAVDDRDLSSLRAVMSGAAPLGDATAAACCRRLDCTLSQGYGLTETSPVTHLATAEEYAKYPGTIGRVVPNTEVKVVNAAGVPLPHGERGQICVRGPQVMKGYLDRPQATAEMIDADGWLHTGDVGYADERGRFFVVDRMKELIKYKGCQVAPAELEALLLTHPAVLDAAVIGVPDEAAGELPKGFVVLREAVAPEALQAWVAERVAPFKKLRRLEIVEEIPKSPSGKILRRVLSDRERKASAGG